MRTYGFCLLLLIGCGDDSSGGSIPDAAAPDAAMPDGAGPDGGPQSCNRQMLAADRVRRVVVSYPYDSQGNTSSDWEVLPLSADGTLAASGMRFQMGRATDGVIAMTPDGQIGLAPQEDGSLGVFKLDADGTPHVLAAHFAGSFYAMRVIMDASGDFAWVLDTQWRNNGGGIYRVNIGCDGTPSDGGLWQPSKLPAAFIPHAGKLVIQATDFLSSTAGDDVFLVDPAGPSIVASAQSFGDDQAIVSAAALSSDGQYLLVADDNQFSGIPNRVAVVGVGGSSLLHLQVLTPINDPYFLIPSPFDDTVLVASGMDNALIVLEQQNSTTMPYHVRGELTYQGGRPQLPGVAVQITRGSLRGRVLVTEVGGIRQVQFAAGAIVTDHGVSALAVAPGAIGVQP
jgi:hypothetical protein